MSIEILRFLSFWTSYCPLSTLTSNPPRLGKGELKAGEKLPTVRQLASDAGVNTMTVNKTYQILKAEGFIKTDRKLGAFVAENINMDIEFREKLESELELLSAEASITGMDKEEFLKMCENIYSKMNPCAM